MSAAPFVEADGLCVSLGGRRVVDNVTFRLCGGEMIALLGPNGAGKSSLLRAIAGLVPHRGGLRLFGRAAPSLSRAEQARRIAYLPQQAEAAWPLPAREIVALGRLPHGARSPLQGEDARAVAAAMARVDALALEDRPVDELSGGERARVLLARALATGADLLLCDEPAASLDPAHQLGVMRALQAEARAGRCVVAVMHDVGLALRFCDRFILMRQGALIADRASSSAFDDEALERAYAVRFARAQAEGVPLVAPLG